MYKISRIKETWGVFRFGRLTTLTTSLSLPPVTTTTTNTFPRYSLVKAFYLLFFLAVCVFVYVFNNSFTIPVSFHRIQLSLSLCIILAQVCVLCSWSSLESNYKLEGGGSPIWWYCSQARASHSSQRDEERSRAKVVGFVFSSFCDGCVVAVVFCSQSPIRDVAVGSLSRLFSVVRFWHTACYFGGYTLSIR